jgi:acyl-coenzyme A synthetase/AMP-(fatty) acid ligase
MRMLQNSPASLASALDAGRDLSARFVFGAEQSVAWSELLSGSCLDRRASELRGRSILIETMDQLTAVSALIELDGVARRIVLYPPDLSREHLPFVASSAEADVIVSDRGTSEFEIPGVTTFIHCDGKIVPGKFDRSALNETEWILLTSGTTGRPKLVVHTLASLAGAIENRHPTPSHLVWSTFYDIRRYGGLQIFLRALLTGSSLLLSSASESTADFLARAGAHGVTHISGTPSHWRRALMSSAAHLLAPEYARLSGEIADQAILNQLHSFYPQASISHAFASTEAGVAFDVRDGLTGFSPNIIENTPGVEMKVEQGSLRIRSDRTATHYLNYSGRPLRDEEGFVDTGDMLEQRVDRYYFVGRRDGVINVGGLKVHPEEVEEVINRHPEVRMSLVRTRKNPLTGALVVADVVLKTQSRNGNETDRAIQQDILLLCREALPSHKVPAVINFVAALAVAETGKLIRRYA